MQHHGALSSQLPDNGRFSRVFREEEKKKEKKKAERKKRMDKWPLRDKRVAQLGYRVTFRRGNPHRDTGELRRRLEIDVRMLSATAQLE